MEYPPGYTCVVTLSRLEVYLHGSLSRVEAVAVAEHLEACPPCAQRLATLPRPPAGGTRADG